VKRKASQGQYGGAIVCCDVCLYSYFSPSGTEEPFVSFLYKWRLSGEPRDVTPQTIHMAMAAHGDELFSAPLDGHDVLSDCHFVTEKGALSMSVVSEETGETRFSRDPGGWKAAVVAGFEGLEAGETGFFPSSEGRLHPSVPPEDLKVATLRPGDVLTVCVQCDSTSSSVSHGTFGVVRTGNIEEICADGRKSGLGWWRWCCGEVLEDGRNAKSGKKIDPKTDVRITLDFSVASAFRDPDELAVGRVTIEAASDEGKPVVFEGVPLDVVPFVAVGLGSWMTFQGVHYRPALATKSARKR
jgi:hypothetical protein